MAQRVSVFGLGYVGCVSAACFANEGHTVVGVDVSAAKVEMLNAGQATIVEHGIAELVRAMRADGRMRATTDVREGVLNSDISLVCVGTPSKPNGSLDLSYVERVCTQIGEALRDKPSRHTVVIRSTVLPGSTHEIAIPALQRASGKAPGKDFAVCMNPEFLREGTILPRPSSVTIAVLPPIWPRDAASGSNDWHEIVRLRDEARAVIAAHCREPLA